MESDIFLEVNHAKMFCWLDKILEDLWMPNWEISVIIL